jgi:mannose-6-phosphate isomerase
MSLYPLKFQPRFLEKMWAGRKIETVLGKALPPGKNIGESWELYDFPPGVVDSSPNWISSVVAEGPLAGRTLHELIQQYGSGIHGDASLVQPHGQFPILLKFLDAKEDLSIQVHPDAAYAARHPNAFLKNEAWFIVQSDPGSRLFRGLRPGTTPEQFIASIEQGHCERLLNSVPVKAGQCFYLPSGTVHAVGAGVLAAEVQTPSDTTYRVYDFDRVDPSTGKKRQLHVEQALACMHFNPPPEREPTEVGQTGVKRLVECGYFDLDEVREQTGHKRPLPYDEAIIWMVLNGEALVHSEGLDSPVYLGRGDTVLFPAAMTPATLEVLRDCHWLEISFPISPAAA